jgi:hypothetical protein
VQTKKTKKSSLSDAFFDAVGAVVPSCGPAMRMVEIGQERPLTLGEKFVLTYNSPLCLHCNCNRRKFKEGRAKMRELEAGRRRAGIGPRRDQ